MGFVVLRRFRDGTGPASSRVYPDERHAVKLAREWAKEGWEVELITSGQRESRKVRLASPPPMPARPRPA